MELPLVGGGEPTSPPGGFAQRLAGDLGTLPEVPWMGLQLPKAPAGQAYPAVEGLQERDSEPHPVSTAFCCYYCGGWASRLPVSDKYMGLIADT